MSKFDQLRTKSLVSKNVRLTTYSEGAFLNLVKSNQFEVYTIADINRARMDMYKALKDNPGNPEYEKELLSSAKKDFEQLQKIEVEFRKGGKVDLYIKKKEAAKSKDDTSEDDDQGGDNGDDGGKPQKKKPTETDEESEDQDGNGVADNQEDQGQDDDQDQGNNDQGGNGNDDGDLDDELSDEEVSVLNIIKQALEADDDGTVDERELEEGEGAHDDTTHAVVISLAKKGYIEIDEDSSITGITDKGNQALDASGVGDGDDDTPDNTDGGDTGNDNTDPNMDNTQNGNQAPPDGQDNGSNSTHSPEELAAMAAKTETDVLEQFVADPNQPDDQKAIAQAELDKRKAGGDDGQGDGAQAQQGAAAAAGGANANPNAIEEEEFHSFVDQHFDDHDKEDFQEYVKNLIMGSPAKIKELKEHYREDYQAKNGGNKVIGKIDPKEFEEYVDEYLNHMTPNDLKNYAKNVLKKSPDGVGDLKKKFKSLKQNNMLN